MVQEVEGGNTPMVELLASLATSASVSHPVVGPEGNRVAFYSGRSGQREIWVFDIDTREFTQVSTGGVPNSGSMTLLWGPDGERLFFERAHDGSRETNLYSITVPGDVEQLTDFADRRCLLRDISPDGRSLLFTTDATGEWQLYRYDRHMGETTHLNATVWSPQIGGYSPTGNQIAFPAPPSDTDSSERDSRARDVAIINEDGTKLRVLDVGEPSTDVVSRAWHPDGTRLFITCTGEAKTHHGWYDLTQESVTWLGGGTWEEVPITYLAQNQALLVLRRYEFADIPVCYPLDGEPYPLEVPEGSVTLPSEIASPELTLSTGDLLLRHTAPDTPPRLLQHNLTTGASEPLIESQEREEMSFVDAEEVSFESSDGVEIHGLMYDSGVRPSPAVVRVKGGPGGRITKRFDPFLQLLLREGYSVLEPNYRGSDGRGQAFRELAFGNIGAEDADDVAAAARWLAAEDGVDTDRIAVYGHSHGAYLVYMMMVRYPELWAAGVAWNGFTDLLRLEEEHAIAHIEWLLGERADNEALWRERSPITHIESLQAPLLMLHGEADWIPVTQARRFRDRLIEQGWQEGDDFRYEELSGQGHRSTDPVETIHRWESILEFLNDHLFPDSEPS